MKADLCKLDVTPESSVNCANQFVEKNVVMAVQGVDVAADAMLPVIKQAGIVEFGFFAFTPGMNNAVGDAYFSLFSQEEGYAADLLTQQSLGAKKEAIIQADLPTAHAVLDKVIKPTAAKLGMEVAPFFYPTQTDWTTLAATILASNPDAISFPAAEDSVCLSGVPALRKATLQGRDPRLVVLGDHRQAADRPARERDQPQRVLLPDVHVHPGQGAVRHRHVHEVRRA